MYSTLLLPGWLPAIVVALSIMLAATLVWLGRNRAERPRKAARTARRPSNQYQGLLDDPRW